MIYLLSNALWKESKLEINPVVFINSANISILKNVLPKYGEFAELGVERNTQEKKKCNSPLRHLPRLKEDLKTSSSEDLKQVSSVSPYIGSHW